MDNQDFRMPEVSVISSWAVRMRHETPITNLPTEEEALDTEIKNTMLPGIDRALNEGIDVLDLYLLDHHEIPIYAGAARLAAEWNDWRVTQNKNPERTPSGRFATPAAFLATLETHHLDKIADFLQKRLAQQYKGRGIGRRPRIAAIATHFPHISLSPDLCDAAASKKRVTNLREISVKALRAALYLAERLGAHCVEAVCGTKVALPKSDSRLSPLDCETARWDALKQSLEEVFSLADSLSQSCPPYLALEIEPGLPYLLSDANDFSKLHQSLSSSVRKKIGLNADLAHFFLTGMDDPSAITKELRDYIFPRIFHAHLSDHAGDYSIGGVHASDLIPGSFHKFSKYEPWLELLCDKDKTPNFSGVIAIEQEASFQIEDIIAARSIVQRWLNLCGKRTPRAAWKWAADWPHDGAFLVIDIGNSTDAFLGDSQIDSREAAIKLGAVIAALCDAARVAGGSALNFTGDGLLLLFEERLQPGMAAQRAADFARSAFSFIEKADFGQAGEAKNTLTLRCALHWGTCYIPTDGPLRDNGIGRDVVYTTRLCSWLGDTIEKAVPRQEDKPTVPIEPLQIGATCDFHDKYASEQWQYWGTVPFKGLSPKVVYLWKPAT